MTLKQLVEEQKWNGINDIKIIETFFELNDMEEEGIDLINELTKSKIEKLKYRNRIVKDWVTILPSKYLYENYDLDIADKLHTLELDFLSNGYKLSNYYLNWAKENIPDIKKPQVYFVPLLEYMESEDIKFKDI